MSYFNKISENDMNNRKKLFTIVTAGSAYLDIDAYACMVALAELLKLQGKTAVAFSNAPCNHSVCKSLIKEKQVLQEIPFGTLEETCRYIIVDVSDPAFLKDSVPIDKVIGVYDHHVGFEDYWKDRIGNRANIEFVGAAATLIYREWKKAGLVDQMTRESTLLLIAAILDNTLNLTSSIVTDEDRVAFFELCKKENIDENWCASYFSEVQTSIEQDLNNAILKDVKIIYNNPMLPRKFAQLCIWDAKSILDKISDIKSIFTDDSESWMLNIVDIKQNCSYYVCDCLDYQKKLENIFDICFEDCIAKINKTYLRKEIIKKSLFK